MKLQRTIIVLDAADLDAVSSCWATLLGGTAEKSKEYDDWTTVRVDGEPYLAVQLAPDHDKPQWPAGSPQQIHLDLHVEDLEDARATAERAGATLLQAGDGSQSHGFEVWADPAGHPFCFCWDRR